MAEETIVSLRPVEPEDLDLLYATENAAEQWTVSDSNVPYSRFALAKYIAETAGDIFADRQLRLIIDCRGIACGIADLFDFEPLHSRAAVGIDIAPGYRGQGIAEQALRQLAHYAFGRLHIHQLYAIVANSNAPSLALFREAGYQLAATLPQWLQTANGYEDASMFQLIKGMTNNE